MMSWVRRTSCVTTTFCRRYASSTTTAAPLPKVTLFQYQICPFCNKTKSLLAYAAAMADGSGGLMEHEYRYTYDVVEVNPLTKSELKQLDGTYRKVPIALVDGKQINGSDAILQALLNHDGIAQVIQDRYSNNNNHNGDSYFQDDDSQKWLEYANNDLASLLYPNICRTLSDSYNAFGYVHNVDTFGALQRFSIQSIGSVAMYMAASRIKANRGITDEREALQQALQQLENGLSGDSKFLSRTLQPNLADLVVYGTLRSVEGLKAHDDFVLNNSNGTNIKDWYYAVKEKLNGF